MATGLLMCPDEIILCILGLLDIPELFALTKTSRRLRYISTDPLLHRTRLHCAALTLIHHLSHRPSRSDIKGIYLTTSDVARRHLSRSLVTVGLKKRLAHRPPISSLVSRGILPVPYRTAEFFAPALLESARRLEKERIKDSLNLRLERRKGFDEAVRDGLVAVDWGEKESERVRDIARRFAKRYGSGSGTMHERKGAWERGRVVRNDPPRARVLGLRRFYERLAQSG